MEVLLNWIWLLLAIGAYLFWWTTEEGSARQRREHNCRYRILSLACALILLFPVISLTDDLHAEQATMEDSSRSVMKARNMVQGCLRAGNSPSSAATAYTPDSAAGLHLFSGLVTPVEIPVLGLTLISPHEGRAPPSKA